MDLANVQKFDNKNGDDGQKFNEFGIWVTPGQERLVPLCKGTFTVGTEKRSFVICMKILLVTVIL